jgi:hypothetical protein
MKSLTQKILILALGLAVLPVAALAQAPAPAAQWQADVENAAALACVQAQQLFAAGSLPALQGDCAISSFTRREIVPGIAEYAFRLATGTGAYDLIGIHRVVQETAPYAPAPTGPALLMLHGDAWGFDAAFLSAVDSPAAPDGRALPVFLAQNGVDVWGLDLGWTFVPASTTQFPFFAGWGLARDARDLGLALAVARDVRTRTGEGHAPIHLLAWSRGGQVGYTYLNAETQVPPGLRNAAGFIPVDIFFKTDVEELREGACARADAEEGAIAGGTFESAVGILASTVGQLAKTAPNAPSPVIPGLTNRQVALLLGEATFVLFPPDQQIVPVYHFVGGTFDELGLPTGLLYTDEALWLDFLTGASPFQPEQEIAEGDAVVCDEADLPFDDHLGEITVPVLYVGAGGGFGEFGVYSTTLLGSTDVQAHVVDLTPPAARLFDFGHADLFNGTDAQSLAWQAILSWLQAH